MSAATESTPAEVPVASLVSEATPAAPEPVSNAGDEPSPKKAKVEEVIEPVKPGRKSRQSGGLSVAERTRREAEAIIKDLKDTPEGGRRTRSQTRGTPAPSPVQTSPRAARKPREATPAVKSTEKKASTGRGRGRPPRKGIKPAEEKADEVDANNGTETTSSDAPSATNATEEPAPTENGVNESHEESTPEVDKPAASEPAPVVVEEKKEPEAPSPADPWAAESAAEAKAESVSEKPSVAPVAAE